MTRVKKFHPSNQEIKQQQQSPVETIQIPPVEPEVKQEQHPDKTAPS